MKQRKNLTGIFDWNINYKMSISAKALKKLRNNFLDEEVIIYLKDMNVVTVNEEGQEISISAMTQAYIVDIDEDYIYTGLPDGTVTRVISHAIGPMIEISFPADEQMMGIDMPTDESEVH